MAYFSIIVPLYNKVSYVRKALRSVFDQSFGDWEMVVVDDGSGDGSGEVARECIEGFSDSRKCRLIQQDNAGVGAARNVGVEASSGEYLCFLDADDWWEPNFLEEMRNFIEEYSDAGLWACNYVYYKPGKTHIAVKHGTGYMNYPKAYFENEAMPVWTCAVCIPRTLFSETGGFPVNIKLGEDFLLWSKIAMKNKVAFLDKPLAHYNNDVPASNRATRNLYNPENHMLFNLGWLEEQIAEPGDSNDWKMLLDKLRVNGLMEYWLCDKYYQAACDELKKVDWSKQPGAIVRRYQMPRWFLRCYSRAKEVGARIKSGIF